MLCTHAELKAKPNRKIADPLHRPAGALDDNQYRFQYYEAREDGLSRAPLAAKQVGAAAAWWKAPAWN